MQLAKFRKSFSGGLGGEAAVKELASSRQKDGTAEESLGDTKLDAQDALYKMLEAEDAYVPTKGKERVFEPGQQQKEKRKGVRT